MWQDSRGEQLNYFRLKMSLVTFVKFLRRGASSKQSRASFYLFIHEGFSVTTFNNFDRRKLSSRRHNTNLTDMLSSSPGNSKVNNFRPLTDTRERQSWCLRVCVLVGPKQSNLGTYSRWAASTGMIFTFLFIFYLLWHSFIINISHDWEVLCT